MDRSADILAALPESMAHVSEVFERLSPRALSARSNLVRYAILYLQGGIYLDFDVLAMRPIDDDQLATCFIGEELVWSGDQERVKGAWWVCLRPRNIGWAVAWFVRWIDGLLFFGRFRTARLLDGLKLPTTRNFCVHSNRRVGGGEIVARSSAMSSNRWEWLRRIRIDRNPRSTGHHFSRPSTSGESFCDRVAGQLLDGDRRKARIGSARRVVLSFSIVSEQGIGDSFRQRMR
ncbi:MAG: hypothetical protein EBY80_01400 [Actinobacteria bacterium]|nr:hypothetical protein [Actinomycetota bacterium]